VTSKQDVYSFGILSWEVLARELPFDDMNLQQATPALRSTPYTTEPVPVSAYVGSSKNLKDSTPTPCTLLPQPSTLNPQPPTLNYTPYTLTSHTLNPQP